MAKRKFGGDQPHTQPFAQQPSSYARPLPRAAPQVPTLPPAKRTLILNPAAAPAGPQQQQLQRQKMAELRTTLIKQQKELLEQVGKLRKDVDPAVKSQLMTRLRELAQKIEKLVKAEAALVQGSPAAGAAAPSTPTSEPSTPHTPVAVSPAGTSQR